MPKKKSDDGMAQISISLPREWVEELGREGKRTIGPEIRRRLEASFETQTLDAAYPQTRELLRILGMVARVGKDCFGDWNSDRYSFDVLREGIGRILDEYIKPMGEPVPHPSKMAESILGERAEVNDPKAHGQLLAGIVWLFNNPKRG
ncbi:MAG TPA: hypothetical protein VIJ78_04060 [Pseudolabrys sp.]